MKVQRTVLYVFLIFNPSISSTGQVQLYLHAEIIGMRPVRKTSFRIFFIIHSVQINLRQSQKLRGSHVPARPLRDGRYSGLILWCNSEVTLISIIENISITTRVFPTFLVANSHSSNSSSWSVCLLDGPQL